MYYLPELLRQKIGEVFNNLYSIEITDFSIEHPTHANFGNYSTNVAMIGAKLVKESPMEIAEKLAVKLKSLPITFDYNSAVYNVFSEVTVAGPGFVNFHFSLDWIKYVLSQTLGAKNCLNASSISTVYSNKVVMFEYTDPNPFKVFHIGHLMSNSIGEALSRLIEYQGAKVIRVNYQGDVGMHVAMSLWGLMKRMEEDKRSIADLRILSLAERMSYLGKAYALGATRFKEDADSSSEIKELTKYIYVVSQKRMVMDDQWTPKINFTSRIEDIDNKLMEKIDTLYKEGRSWSIEYFETLYKKLGTRFDSYFFESGVAEYGYQCVKDNIATGIFEESDGAIVFKGDKYGLHTRVFINSQDLPTYEAKDLGLAFIKYDKHPYDFSFVITANEINEYFKVVLKAMSLINPELSKKTTHLGHGMMKLTSGKMSSRTGKIIAGDELLNSVKEAVLGQIKIQNVVFGEHAQDITADKIAVASIKYSILQKNIGDDIVYDPEKSLELTGNTGPYILYTNARAASVLEKAGACRYSVDELFGMGFEVRDEEKAIVSLLGEFEEYALKAGSELSPHVLSGYLYSVCQKFNSYYSEVSISSEKDECIKSFRLHMTNCVTKVLSAGMYLLGIPIVDKM